MAFEYETTDTFANQQAASKWTSTASLDNQLDKTFWTKDFRTRPTSCQLISVSNPVILDDKTAGVTVEAVFSWANIGLKEFPMNLYVVVKKQSDGYRIDTIQFYLHKKLNRSPWYQKLSLSPQTTGGTL
ncbi:MAG: hypothetical protein C0469_06475 [Cyanobacteria bacterium DS2.3.42]|nr:hypothetical protein [Cyanobacteria bacterium DS2.3.42]